MQPWKLVAGGLNAFPLDSLGFGVYTFPLGRRLESMLFLDPLEGTEINAYKCRFTIPSASLTEVATIAPAWRSVFISSMPLPPV